VMQAVAPVGEVDISGTNTGRRLPVIWALAALRELSAPGFYTRLAQLNTHLEEGLREVFARHRVPAYVEGYGGRVGAVIGMSRRPRTMSEIAAAWDGRLQHELFRELTTEHRLYGFLLPLKQGPEPITISAAHTVDDIDEALAALDVVLAKHV
jgi:glutamate-1-semialdehyde 2,1-aminomutase